MKMPRWSRLSLALLAGLASACSTYAPITLDAKSGQYNTTTQLDAGATRVWETGTQPAQFRVVLLNTQTNVYPLRFEFFVRSVLSDLGVRRVLNADEMAALLADRGLGRKVDADSLRKLSEAGLPVLVVDMQSRWDGDVRRHVTLKATDARNGKTLLWIDHPRTVWMEVDGEAHLPVFNALRKWYLASSGRQA